jgi:hypothetical protein
MSPAAPRGIALVSGILFWYPLAGVTYQFLHYLLGLQRLGYRVFYVEDSARWVYDPLLRTMTPDPRANIARVEPVLRAHGLADCWAFRGAYPGGACYGMSHARVLQLYRDADVFLNVTGSQELRDEHMTLRRRLYIETDPFGSQVKLAQGDAALRRVVDAHHAWFTFGENIGQADCAAPVDRQWLPTRQPVLLDLWTPQPSAAGSARYRTISTWHNDGKDVRHRGEVYHWTKDREFLQLVDLPAQRPNVQIELASDADPASRAHMQTHGFVMSDALGVSGAVAQYHAFIAGARAELTVARDQYTRPNTGWFSDRSACFLAAARPVITQHTGFDQHIPVGRGLFAFRNAAEAAVAIDAIESDYAAHSAAALELARAYFAADKVLTHLLERAGL